MGPQTQISIVICMSGPTSRQDLPGPGSLRSGPPVSAADPRSGSAACFIECLTFTTKVDDVKRSRSISSDDGPTDEKGQTQADKERIDDGQNGQDVPDIGPVVSHGQGPVAASQPPPGPGRRQPGPGPDRSPWLLPGPRPLRQLRRLCSGETPAVHLGPQPGP